MSGAGNGLVPTPPPIFDGIPPGLRLLVHWIMWRWMPPPGTKVPVTIDGFGTKWSEPVRWSTFDAIRDRFEKVGKDRFSGVGVWLGDVNDGFDLRFLWGIDIDACLAPDGTLLAWAVAIVGLLSNASYIEISPSGTGLKAFFFSSKAELQAMRTALGMVGLETMGRKFAMPGDGAHPPAVEIYFGKRYFAVTGRRWAGACGDVEEVGVSLITTLLPMLPSKAAADKAKPGPKPKDMSRSAKAFGAVANRIRMGAIAADVEAVREALAACGDPDVVAWLDEKGTDHEISNIIKNALAGEDPPADWLQSNELTRGAKGGLHCNLHNTLVALRFAPELRGVFAYDEMARHVVVRSDLLGDGDDVPRWIRDTDYGAVQSWLQKAAFMTTVSRETVIQAIAMTAMRRRFHPVRDWLDGLVWDGVPRLDDWLSMYTGAEACLYTTMVGRMLLISMVARIHEPGCQVDYCVVLEGEQGIRKSSLLRVLAGAWFDDHMPDISGGHDVRASMHLRGKWIVEVSEMHAFRKAEVERLKAFITRQVENFTPLHARAEVAEPRQGVLVGSTNSSDNLTDATGNRRFWPVTMGTWIDCEGVATVRDQLFAEAVHRYRAGEPWHPDRETERLHFAPQQEERFDTDAWEEAVLDYLADKACVTIGEVIMGAQKLGFDGDMGRMSRADQNRVKAIMIRLGWKKMKKNWRGKTEWHGPRPDLT